MKKRLFGVGKLASFGLFAAVIVALRPTPAQAYDMDCKVILCKEFHELCVSGPAGPCGFQIWLRFKAILEHDSEPVARCKPFADVSAPFPKFLIAR